MNRQVPTAIALCLTAAIATPAFAHAPILDCYVEDGTVKCEAGFSDGVSAAGRRILILDANHRLVLEGVLDENGTFTFRPPAGEYHVVFQGGENHEVTLYSTDIS